MKLLKWTVRIHKWIALIIGIQIFLWILGGFIFSVLDIEKVRGEHKVAPWEARHFDPTKIISLEVAAERAGIASVQEASLGTMLGRPVWRLLAADSDHSEHRRMMTLDGRTGHVLSPINEALATQIAKADYIGPGEFHSIVLVGDPPTEYPHPDAAWVARFDDKDKTTLYINPDSAEVKSRRSQTWRVFDFFWKLHVMDYDDGESFNHPLLVTAAGTAMLVAISGLILLLIKMRRSFSVWRNARVKKR